MLSQIHKNQSSLITKPTRALCPYPRHHLSITISSHPTVHNHTKLTEPSPPITSSPRFSQPVNTINHNTHGNNAYQSGSSQPPNHLCQTRASPWPSPAAINNQNHSKSTRHQTQTAFSQSPQNPSSPCSSLPCSHRCPCITHPCSSLESTRATMAFNSIRCTAHRQSLPAAKTAQALASMNTPTTHALQFTRWDQHRRNTDPSTAPAIAAVDPRPRRRPIVPRPASHRTTP
ncbi:hypothetical protein M0R45_035610 [Rubus argutus]|uniref:Uncharacterized protein n=1 Tax=Rubus argutus TaxID=59490 RepID=A0AAW1VV67_RUBAR